MTDLEDQWFAGLNKPVGDIDSQLGIFIARFGALEPYISCTLEYLMGGNGQNPLLANAIYGHIQSIATKLDVASSCCAISHRDALKKDAISKLIERMRAINTLRNQYAHGLWEYNETSRDVRLILNLQNAKRNVKTKTELDKEISKAIDEMNDITLDLNDALEFQSSRTLQS